MPLPNDENLLALSNDILKQFDAIFGLNPGFRPAHAKGLLLSGTFTPAPPPKISPAPRTSRANPRPSSPASPTPPASRSSRTTIPTPTHAASPSASISPSTSTPTSSRTPPTASPPTPATSSSSSFAPSPPAILQSQARRSKPSSARIPRRSRSCRRPSRPIQLRPRDLLRRHRLALHQRSREKVATAATESCPKPATTTSTTQPPKPSRPTISSTSCPSASRKIPISFRIVVQLAEDGDNVDDATIHWPETRPHRRLRHLHPQRRCARQRRRAEADHLRPHPARRWHRALRRPAPRTPRRHLPDQRPPPPIRIIR